MASTRPRRYTSEEEVKLFSNVLDSDDDDLDLNLYSDDYDVRSSLS